MPQESTLGLKAKLGIETDDRQIDRETNNLKDKVNNAAEAEMSVDTGTLKSDIVQSIEEATNDAKWLPDLDLGESVDTMFDEEAMTNLSNQMGALGKEMDANRMGAPSGQHNDYSLGGEVLSGLKGAGGKFLKVGLAGSIGLGILGAVTKLGSDVSPRMNKNLSMLMTTVSLFARPFFDWIAQWGEDGVQSMLQMAALFNERYAEDGLKVAMQDTGRDIWDKLIGANDEDQGPIETHAKNLGGVLGIGAGAAGGALLGAKAGGMIGMAGGPMGAIAGALAGAFIGLLAGLTAGGLIGGIADRIHDWWTDNVTATDLGAMVMGKFPGWIGSEGVFNAFPSWIGGILPSFPGWIKKSPGVIDAFPGWATWLNPLDWDVPTGSEISGMISNKIGSLSWPNVTKQDIIDAADPRKDVSKESNDGIDPANRDTTMPGREIWGEGAADPSDHNRNLDSPDEAIHRDDLSDSQRRSLGGAKSADDRRGRDLQPMATGGLITKPTKALVGEEGPEIVAPFSDLMSTLQEERRRGRRSRSAGGSDDRVDEIVDALESIEKTLEQIDLDGDVMLDKRKVGEVNRQTRERYRSSRVITR